ncbi:hypothetical protein BRC68_02215 [Halobacteriales archaeon QH_6_64_20]|nr:MAG: hypothetical protein BRC68_02215 [Halobacteriales archaeon QH_6_64_20]
MRKAEPHRTKTIDARLKTQDGRSDAGRKSETECDAWRPESAVTEVRIESESSGSRSRAESGVGFGRIRAERVGSRPNVGDDHDRSGTDRGRIESGDERGRARVSGDHWNASPNRATSRSVPASTR